MTLLKIHTQFGHATDGIESTLSAVEEFIQECDGQRKEINLLKQRMEKFYSDWKNILGEDLTYNIDCELAHEREGKEIHLLEQRMQKFFTEWKRNLCE